MDFYTFALAFVDKQPWIAWFAIFWPGVCVIYFIHMIVAIVCVKGKNDEVKQREED